MESTKPENEIEDEEELKFNDLWEVQKCIMEDCFYIKRKIESFDYFIDIVLPSLMINTPPIIATCTNQNSSHYGETHKITYTGVYIGKPRINEDDSSKKVNIPITNRKNGGKHDNLHFNTPEHSRIRVLNYSSPWYVDIEDMVIKNGEAEIIKYPKVSYGEIPIMVRSKYCLLNDFSYGNLEQLGEDPGDPGGYYIINGNEKTIIGQEKMRVNKILIESKVTNGNKKTYIAKIWSSSEMTFKPPSKVVLFAKIPAGKTVETIKVVIPYLKQQVQIPLGVLFMALGVTTDGEMMQRMVPKMQNDLQMMFIAQKTIEETMKVELSKGVRVSTQQDAWEYIGKRLTKTESSEEKMIRNVKDNLNREFFPHVGLTEDSWDKKSYFLGYMANRLFRVILGRDVCDERDSYTMKATDIDCQLLTGLIYQIVKKVSSDIRSSVQKYLDEGRPINPSLYIKQKPITQKLRYCFRTGNWVVNKSISSKNGVSAVLSRLSYTATVSHLMRINTPIGREGKTTKPRQIGGTQAGRICPAEGPEGNQIGFVKNTTLQPVLSLGDSSDSFIDLLFCYGTVPLLECNSHQKANWYKVIVNGDIVGMVENGVLLVEKMRNVRRSLDLNFEVSISIHWHLEEVRFSSDSGRFLIPALICKDGKPKITKQRLEKLRQSRLEDGINHLMAEGLLEWLDAEEEENALIAMTHSELKSKRDKIKFTHMCIHPVSLYGACGSDIPYSNSNQAPRNSFQSNMKKQAIGISLTSVLKRLDSLSHFSFYLQRPIVNTKPATALGYDEYASGLNCVVACMNYRGKDQEDSVIINKAFIDRGAFRSFYWRLYKEEERKLGNLLQEQFEVPKPETCADMKKHWDYSKLDDDGVIGVGEEVKEGTVLLGRTAVIPVSDSLESSKYTHTDHSLASRSGENGIVDKVVRSTNSEGYQFVKISVRSVRIPEIGDKFSSRHGQKGVCGDLVSEEDMPFCAYSGIIPDIILNPHAFPSRMTIGMVIESLVGKSCALAGTFGDATPFEPRDLEDAKSILRKNGFECQGNEIMYSGTMGEPIEGEIYQGIVYYQRLKHLVKDKFHARSTGPRQILTRQPVEGRAREGGLRFGEMERDCLLGHGVSQILNEILFKQSDFYQMHFCSSCGSPAVDHEKLGTQYCKVCDSKTGIFKINIPYAAKLLYQELISASVMPSVQFDKEFTVIEHPPESFTKDEIKEVEKEIPELNEENLKRELEMINKIYNQRFNFKFDEEGDE